MQQMAKLGLQQLSSSLLFLAMASLAHLVYRRLARHTFSRRRGCQQAKSRAPVKDPYFGFDFIYDSIFGGPEEKYLESALETFRRLGPTYTVKRWSWEVIYTADGRNIKHLLAGGFGDFALPRLRVAAMSTLLGRGIFTLNGTAWAHARAVLKPMFARLDKQAVTSALEPHFQAMLGRFPDAADGAPVDLQMLFFRLAMDFAGDHLMGNPGSGPAAGDAVRAERFVDDYVACSREVVKKLRLGPLQHLRFSPAAFLAKRRVFRYIDDFIDEALSRSGPAPAPPDGAAGQAGRRSGSILSGLAAVTQDRKTLRDQVLHILVASRDTTASVLSNLFFVLAQNPKAFRRLRQEVLAVAGDEVPTAAQLKQMEYVRWCVDESLRLHPVIPVNAREATRDTTLPHGGGPDGNAPLLIPRGVVVMYNTYALHRDERVFGSRPEAFEPERWRGLRPGWGYLPFSGGPRICMGQQLALTEVQYVAARMAQTFQAIEGRGEREWVELDALATTCRGGVKVSLTRASS